MKTKRVSLFSLFRYKKKQNQWSSFSFDENLHSASLTYRILLYVALKEILFVYQISKYACRRSAPQNNAQSSLSIECCSELCFNKMWRYICRLFCSGFVKWFTTPNVSKRLKQLASPCCAVPTSSFILQEDAKFLKMTVKSRVVEE